MFFFVVLVVVVFVVVVVVVFMVVVVVVFWMPGRVVVVIVVDVVFVVGEVTPTKNKQCFFLNFNDSLAFEFRDNTTFFVRSAKHKKAKIRKLTLSY